MIDRPKDPFHRILKNGRQGKRMIKGMTAVRGNFYHDSDNLKRKINKHFPVAKKQLDNKEVQSFPMGKAKKKGKTRPMFGRKLDSY